MNKILSIATLFVLVAVPGNSMAQSPPDWTVNPTDFLFNTSMIGVLVFNGLESTDSEDIIAAFVGDECRGIDDQGFYFEPTDHWVWGITLFANTNGETFTFKAYDASADFVFEITGYTYEFIPNDIVGSAEDPVVWSFLPDPPDSFNYISTPSSGVFQGQITVNGSYDVGEFDWIAAFDEDENCAGAEPITIVNGTSYINLPIYGDDMTSPDVDEGINAGEDFVLRLWDSSHDVIYEYSESFDCWFSNNGAPMTGCGDINTVYNFETGNEAPVLVFIGDQVTNEDTPLTIILSASDADGDVLNYSAIIIDNEDVSVIVTGEVLTFTLSENYNGFTFVTVTVSDGFLNDDETFILTVTAVNDIPVAEIVFITPSVPLETDDLLLDYDYDDVEGDAEFGTTITWFKDSAEHGEFDNQSIVPASATGCNEEWYASVTPADGTDAGYPVQSNSVTICGINSPPVWSEITPQHILEDSGSENEVEMEEFVTDGEQAPIQMMFTVESSSNPVNLGAEFSGSTLKLSTLTENYYTTDPVVLGLRVSDGDYTVDANMEVYIDQVNDAPVLSAIDNQEINEDTALVMTLSAEDVDGDALAFDAFSEYSDSVSVSLTGGQLTLTPSDNYFGTVHINVSVTDGEYTDSDIFALIVRPVNDAPNNFSLIYPTLQDTFSTHVNGDIAIAFTWNESIDIDSEVSYSLTLEWEFDGNTYIDIHQNITDTTFSVLSNSLDALLGGLNMDELNFYWFVQSSDGEYTTVSDTGEFVLMRATLNTVDENISPKDFSLQQAYPNPFNPITTLHYDLPKNIFITISIYNILGKQIKVLVNITQEAGFKSVQWDATDSMGRPVSAGVYLYQIQAGDFVQTKKMVLLK